MQGKNMMCCTLIKRGQIQFTYFNSFVSIFEVQKRCIEFRSFSPKQSFSIFKL